MKKLSIILALVMLAACSKQSDQLVAQQKDEYLSKVRHYKDQRQPGTDTVWTWHLYTQALRDSFARFDGYIYQETNTYKEVGVIWSK